MFSTRSFMVLGLTFKSLLYFEFIFVHGMRDCSSLILLHVAVKFSQHIYSRECLSPLYCLMCFLMG